MSQFDLIHNMLQYFNVYHEVAPGTDSTVQIKVGRKTSFIITFSNAGVFTGISVVSE